MISGLFRTRDGYAIRLRSQPDVRVAVTVFFPGGGAAATFCDSEREAVAAAEAVIAERRARSADARRPAA